MKALVTGASSGIGREMAKILSDMGYDLILVARRKKKLEELKKQLTTKVTIINLDISSTYNCMKLYDKVKKEDIDIVINNAGFGLFGEFTETSLDKELDMIDTNIKGLVTITRLVLPQMVERNSGHIINLGSIAGTYPYPGGNVYGGTKAFIKQFSLNLRADLAGTQIRVTNVEPGLCGGTEFSNIRFKGDDARAKKLYENVEYVSPQDIANIVLWLNQQPEHVNINRIEVMPTAQTFAPLNVARIQK